MTDNELFAAFPPADHKPTPPQQTDSLPFPSSVHPFLDQARSPQSALLKELPKTEDNQSVLPCKPADCGSPTHPQHKPCSKSDHMPPVAEVVEETQVNKQEEIFCKTSSKTDTKMAKALSKQQHPAADRKDYAYSDDSVQNDFPVLVLSSVNMNNRESSSDQQQLQCQQSEAQSHHFDSLFEPVPTLTVHSQSLGFTTQGQPGTSHDAEQQFLQPNSAMCTPAPALPEKQSLLVPAFGHCRHLSLASDKIDHDLKPLQIQHNLEDKMHQLKMTSVVEPLSQQNKPPSLQQLEKNHEMHVFVPQSVQENQEDSEAAGMHIRITNVHSLSAACSFHGVEDSRFLASLQSFDAVEAPVSTTAGFHTTGGDVVHFPNYGDDEALYNNCHTLTFNPPCMEQYLLDVDDLPQFSNIPTDSSDVNCCTDTMHLTPTIPPQPVHFEWQHPWYDHTPKKDTTTGYPGATMTSVAEQVTDQVCHLPPAVSSSTTVLYIPATSHSSALEQETQPITWSGSDMQTSGKTGKVPLQERLPVTMTSSIEGNPRHAARDECLPQALTPALEEVTVETSQPTGKAKHAHSFDSPALPNKNEGCPSSFLSPPPSVEAQPCLSNSGTPAPEESGYLTLEEQELVSPVASYWPQPHFANKMDGDSSSFKIHTTRPSSNCTILSAPATCGPGGGGGRGSGASGCQHNLHEHVEDAVQTPSAASDDAIYYPFSDLMQLHPSLLGDQEPSIRYIPATPPHFCPLPQQTLDTYSTTQPPLPSARRRRQGLNRGQSAQIQSDQITSSLQRKQEERPLTSTHTKRGYKRRASCTDIKQRHMSIKAEATKDSAETNAGEKRSRHNEPLNQKAVSIMFEWYCQNEENPYPSKEEKERMAREGGITTMQVKSWFANKRNRSNNTRPKVQKRAMEEKLMQICNHLSREKASCMQQGDNAFIIKELSQIIHTFEKDSS